MKKLLVLILAVAVAFQVQLQAQENAEGVEVTFFLVNSSSRNAGIIVYATVYDQSSYDIMLSCFPEFKDRFFENLLHDCTVQESLDLLTQYIQTYYSANIYFRYERLVY